MGLTRLLAGREAGGKEVEPSFVGVEVSGRVGERATLLGQSPEALAALGYAFAERAAIHEYDGGLPRGQFR